MSLRGVNRQNVTLHLHAGCEIAHERLVALVAEAVMDLADDGLMILG